MHVLGRRSAVDAGGEGGDEVDPGTGDEHAGHLGAYRARDGSAGADVGVDLDGPHAGMIVGKRGYGKSHTLGVLAEAAARTTGVAPVVLDPAGALGGLAADAPPGAAPVPATHVREPRVAADAVPPSAWPSLLGLDETDPAGALVWRAAATADSLAGMRAAVGDPARRDGGPYGNPDCDSNGNQDGHPTEDLTGDPIDNPGAPVADDAARLAAANHLELAASWGVFAPDGASPSRFAGGAATVLDLSGLDAAPANAVCRAVVRGLYEARVAGEVDRLPWLLIDEAHAFFGGIADPALRTALTRGRAPGVSLVAATQRPAALPDVAVSQADLLFAHRLTSAPDVDALEAARPTYLDGAVRDRLPAERGVALVVDDATESAHLLRVRGRATPHSGASPRASDR